MMKAIPLAGVLFVAIMPCIHAQVLPVESNRYGGDLINDVDQSTVALHAATPYLESSSLLLADIDVEEIDIAATAKWLHDILGTSDSEEDLETLRGFLDSLKGGGVSHIYVTAATRSPLDGGPIVVIPCQNPAVVSGLATVAIQQAPDQPPQKVHAGNKVVLAGAARAIDRVVAREGTNRPDLILPLKSADLLDHSIVIALPVEAREELSAFWPEQLSIDPLPAPISPRQIATDVLRVIVSLRLPPEPEMLVRIETVDAGAADRVKSLLEEILSIAGDAKPMIQLNVDVSKVNLHATPEAFFKLASSVAAPAMARAKRMQTSNAIKQINLALHNYYSSEKHLPPRAFTDAQGGPLLSWRVAILPYIDQSAIYRAIKLDQPWDSEDNRPITSTLIPVYCADGALGNKTTIRAPVFPGSMWEGEGPPKQFRDVRDGLSNTIAFIDAPESAAIEWANPQPWVLSVDDPMSDVFGDRESVTVGMFDGASVVLKREEWNNENLKALLTIAGGEVIEWGK